MGRRSVVMTPIALATKSSPARFTQGGVARLMNCYVEQIGEEGKTPWAVYAADGLQGFAATPDANGGIRACLEVGGSLYYVCGTGFYKVTQSGDVVLLGSMNISRTAPVYMERNRRAVPDIAIVCDGLMYYYRTTFQQVTDMDLLAPTSLASVNGMFVIGTANNTWQVGTIDDASAWDGSNFERADANPDAVVRVSDRQGEAVIFGEKSTEFWQDVGGAYGAGFNRAAANDLGILSANSVATVDQTLVWVAHDRTVRMLGGYHGQRISDHAVERDIEALSDRTQLQASSWVKDGHTFYKLTSPEWTWVYDTTTQKWHNRSSYLRPNWRVSTVTAFGGRLIAGDFENGNLYEMGSQFHDDAGQPMLMELTPPPVHAFPHPLTFNALHFDVERGVGTGQGAPDDVDPSLMLRWSDDGGATFRFERTLKLGQQGKRMQRVATYRLGQSGRDGRVFKLSCSARVARAIYQIMADVEKDAA